MTSFDDFYAIIGQKHRILDLIDFTTSYTDPIHGDLLPINNDENFRRALSTATPLLRVFVYRKSGIISHFLPTDSSVLSVSNEFFSRLKISHIWRAIQAVQSNGGGRNTRPRRVSSARLKTSDVFRVLSTRISCLKLTDVSSC